MACQAFQAVSRLVDSYEESISPNVQHTYTNTSNNGLKNAKTRYKPRVYLLPRKLPHTVVVRQRNIFLPQYK
jgi:hypothetical protein